MTPNGPNLGEYEGMFPSFCNRFLNSDNRHLRIDGLHQAFDARERGRKRTRTTAAGALIVNLQCLAFQPHHMEIATIAL